jgi:hypothetical protein
VQVICTLVTLANYSVAVRKHQALGREADSRGCFHPHPGGTVGAREVESVHAQVLGLSGKDKDRQTDRQTDHT